MCSLIASVRSMKDINDGDNKRTHSSIRPKGGSFESYYEGKIKTYSYASYSLEVVFPMMFSRHDLAGLRRR
jgi:hypothetical protein